MRSCYQSLGFATHEHDAAKHEISDVASLQSADCPLVDKLRMQCILPPRGGSIQNARSYIAAQSPEPNMRAETVWVIPADTSSAREKTGSNGLTSELVM